MSQALLLTALRPSLQVEQTDELLDDHAASFILYAYSDNLRSLTQSKMVLDLYMAIIDPLVLWEAMEQVVPLRRPSRMGSTGFGRLALHLLLLLSPTNARSDADLLRTARSPCSNLITLKATSFRCVAIGTQTRFRKNRLEDVGVLPTSNSSKPPPLEWCNSRKTGPESVSRAYAASSSPTWRGQ